MLSKISLLKYFFKDPDKKSYLKIAKELVVYAWVKKEWPIDYFRKSLYKKNIDNYTEYLSLKQYYSIIESDRILVRDMVDILENKLSFALFAKAQHIPTPKTLSYNFGKCFFYNSQNYHINTPKALKDFFLMVMENSKQNALFIKPISGVGGKNCLLLTKQQLETTGWEAIAPRFNHNYIHQEKIEQHPDINTIYSNAINTLRVNTFLDKAGAPHIISALMRFGSGNLVTDNESSGGFFVAVNTKNGTLTGPGQQTIARSGKTYSTHPDTNTKLEGFKIPFIKEALKLCCETAIKVPTRIVGWDIAITKLGPVIIEGNYNTSLHMADMAYGGLEKNPTIKTIFKEINE